MRIVVISKKYASNIWPQKNVLAYVLVHKKGTKYTNRA